MIFAKCSGFNLKTVGVKHPEARCQLCYISDEASE